LKSDVGCPLSGVVGLDPIMYVAKQSAYVILIGIVGVVTAVLIVWYAWKSKQKV
jgi:hypothetical protein